MKQLLPLTLLIALIGCDNTNGNHIGNPLTLPGRGIVTGVENAIYNSRRKRVSEYVQANFSSIKTDILAFEGTSLTHAYNLAKVSINERAMLTERLNKDRNIYFTDDPEPLIVALMVHGQ